MNVLRSLKKDAIRNKYVYFMAFPVLAYYILFHYLPMGGLVMAFQDYSLVRGVSGSTFVGFDNFISFFTNFQFPRLIRNTLTISVAEIIFGFPAPIILALLINEVRGKFFKRTVQTISYMPHFISLVVISGIILNFTSSDGVIMQLYTMITGNPGFSMLMRPNLFLPVYVISGIWMHVGWGSIIYLAAISSVDPGLYESAAIDGAGRFRRIWSITLPSILPTISILLIMRAGSIMSVGFERVFLLYNPTIFETADVISTFVYRRGIIGFEYGFSAAVGMFNSVINFVILISVNAISGKFTGNRLW